MPYIRLEDRDAFDCFIIDLQWSLRSVPRDKRKGALNYVLSRLALGTFGADLTATQGGILAPQSYHDISDTISALRDAADEIARRVMGPREDYALEVNGDLDEYFNDRSHEH